jgi:hypothetical protein
MRKCVVFQYLKTGYVKCAEANLLVLAGYDEISAFHGDDDTYPARPFSHFFV